jgi:two-component system NtrC family sensor kinase
MRLLLLVTFGFLNCYTSSGQDVNKLMQEYDTAKNTTSKTDIFYKYYSSSGDSVPEMIIKLVNLSNQLKRKKDPRIIAIIDLVLADKYSYLGDYTNSLRYSISSLKNFEDVKDSLGIIRSLFLIGNSLVFSKNYDQALVYLKKAVILTENNGDILHADILNAAAYCMVMLKKPDSAFVYIKPAIEIGWREKDTASLAYYIGTLGEGYLAKKNYDLAKPLINQSFQYSLQNNMKDLLANNSNDLSQLYYETEVFDSSIYYARKGIYYAGSRAYLLDAYEWLYKSFEKQEQKDSVSKYFRLAVTLRDSIFSVEKNRTVQSMNFQQQLWEKENAQNLIRAQKEFRYKLTLYISFGIVIIILIVAILLYRNSQQQKKSKHQIEKAYGDLKSAQSQLIQSEKMASLGELTAGIAHEIQNPLNFVNNFSEVNKELVEELKIKNEKLKIEDDEVRELLNDITQNLEKINHHGKRADAIVKGMLQHSRTSSGQKELTDINALCDEYLRLAYHGFRAKDKSVNAVPIAIGIKTDFDPTVGKITVVPQDIGRVMLNLINNAFFAVGEKAKLKAAGYMPLIFMSTKRKRSNIELRIEDNGTGIPQKIIDKIFQPFFTTKPTGQGTGLGLSLTYDIVKGHGGEIRVETKEGEGSKFILQLPLQENV